MMRAWLITALLALFGAESALAASKGTLVIRSPQKNATVTVNGLAAGKTPLKAMKLRPGKYKIEISRLGFMTYRKTVRVVEGETRLVKTPLTRGGWGGCPSVKCARCGSLGERRECRNRGCAD